MNKTTTILSFLLIVCMACNNERKVAEQTARKPNIIYILADDLGYGDPSCYGQQKFKTPNIDRLAAEGMLFTQHYAGTAVCAPSRSSLMTGLHTGHTFVRGNRGMHGGQFPLPDSAVILPELLKKAGYVTGCFGKWGLGYPGSTGDPINQGIDEFFGFNSQTLAHNYYPYFLWHNREKVMLDENSGEKKGAYAPNLIQEQAMKFLEQNKDTTFFLYVPTTLPHAELAAPEKYMEQFEEPGQPEKNFGFQSIYGPEKPYHGVDDIDNPRYKTGGYASQPYPHAAFAAMVKVLDDQVGEIMDKVKALRIQDNTLIIFTSDNGPHLEGGADPDYFDSNGPLKGYKRDLYEGGIREPMIASWPGKIKAGSKTDLISAFWDVMPTLCDLAGVKPPNNIDGISFLPTLLAEQGQQQHDYLYWEFHEKGGRVAARKGKWKAVKYNVIQHPDASLELYDLSEDIGEEHNVAAQHPDVVAQMEDILKKAHTEDPAWPFIASN